MLPVLTSTQWKLLIAQDTQPSMYFNEPLIVDATSNNTFEA